MRCHDLRGFSGIRHRLLGRNSVFGNFVIFLLLIPLWAGFLGAFGRALPPIVTLRRGVVEKQRQPDEQGDGKQTPATIETSKTQKEGMQHEDFPGGHQSQYYSRPNSLNFGVLMGSGACELV